MTSPFPVRTLSRVLFAMAVAGAPFTASATTVVVEGGGPYDVTSDTLFTGIAISFAGGAGTYTTDYFSPGTVVGGVAEAAVTTADVASIFTDLSMSWLDGQSLNTLVQIPGLDTLSTVFEAPFLSQRLQFAWSDSVQGAGFGFDVTTTPAPIPLPASAALLLAGLAGLGDRAVLHQRTVIAAGMRISARSPRMVRWGPQRSGRRQNGDR